MTDALQVEQSAWCSTQDAQAVHRLHRSAVAKAWSGQVRPETVEHFAAHQGSAGSIVANYNASGQLVAYGVLALVMPIVSRFAALLGADPARVCVLDGCAVDQDWRGHRLHEAAIVERLRLATALGRPAAVATVAPQNLPSLRSLLRAGFEVRRFALLYGGLPRFVLYRPAEPRLAAPPCELRLSMHDVGRHQQALAAGWVGHACCQSPDGDWCLDYASSDKRQETAGATARSDAS